MQGKHDDGLSARGTQMWSRLYDSWRSFHQELADFLRADDVDRVVILREGIKQFSTIPLALEVVPGLPPTERCELLGDLLDLSLSVRWNRAARDAILSLPREWILSNIEKEAGPILEENTAWEYRRMLELYFVLDYNLTHHLVQRALNHPDEEIQEAGRDFLELLDEVQS